MSIPDYDTCLFTRHSIDFDLNFFIDPLRVWDRIEIEIRKVACCIKNHALKIIFKLLCKTKKPNTPLISNNNYSKNTPSNDDEKSENLVI
jgi:hypothetical protein